MVEHHLVHALEVSSEWLMVLEGDRVIYSNGGFLKNIRRSPEQVVGRKLRDILTEKFCPGLDGLMDEIRSSGGRVVTGTLECSDEIMDIDHINVRGEALAGFTYLSIDRQPIVESEADERLMEVEDKLSALLGLATNASLGVGVFEISPEGVLLPRSFNEHVVEIFGRTQEEMVGQDPAKWAHPNDVPVLREMVAELQEHGANSSPYQIRVIGGSGSVVHTQVTNSMLSPPNEHLGVSFIQDITPMKEALDSQNRMVQAMDRIQETVVMADARGRIFYANPTALRNSGFTLEEVVGKPITIFHAPEGLEPFATQAMVELLKRGWWRGDVMACTKDGVRYPVEVIGSVVRDEEGELSTIVVVSRKTQERQRFEAQLLMARSNDERMRGHLEQELFPALSEASRRLDVAISEGDRTEMEEVLREIRSNLLYAKETLASLPNPEEAERLVPTGLRSVLAERIPRMVERHASRGVDLSVAIEPVGEDTTVMANEMLPDLIMQIVQVLLELAQIEDPRFRLTLATRTGLEIPGSREEDWRDGKEPVFACVSISCPGLTLDEDLRSILTRQELHTRGPLPPGKSLAVETTRLLLFLYGGRVIAERLPEGGGEAVVVLLPVA